MLKSKTRILITARRLVLLAFIPLGIFIGGQNALASSLPVQQLKNSFSIAVSGPATGPCKGLTGAELNSCQACQDPNNTKGCLKNNVIVKDINNIIKVLSGLVAVVVTAVIIIGGIQYAISGDRADAVSAAKKRITNGLIALVVFMFIFSIVQWLIPGGIFNK